MPGPLSRLLPRSRRWRIALGVGSALALLVAWWLWRMFRVEDIPEQLDAMEESPDDIVLETLSDVPNMRLGDQRGFKSFYLVVGKDVENREGVALSRALNRWQYPESTKGYIVGDAEGARMFAGLAERYVAFFRKEARFPLYLDFDGAMLRVFKLPKGHQGFVVLGEDGKVLLRKSGGMKPGPEIDELRELLGASEPPPPPPAPEFTLGELSKEECSSRACAIIFLGEPVQRADIPGIEGGFDGSPEEKFERLDNPAIRMAATALKMDLKGAPGVLVGEIGAEAPGWDVIAQAAEARQAFDVQEGETAMIVVDEQGRLAFRQVGLIPMYHWGLAADILGSEMKEEDS